MNTKNRKYMNRKIGNKKQTKNNEEKGFEIKYVTR